MARNMKLMTCSMVLVVALASTGMGQTTWTGTNSDDWTDGGNWSAGLPGDAIIGDTAVGRDIFNAGGTLSGFTWDQSSAAVSQITLGSDLDVASGPRVFNNTSGSAGNMVLDLNGFDFRLFTVGTLSPVTIQTSSPGGTFTQGDGSFTASGMNIGAGVTIQGPTWQGWTLVNSEANPGTWDPTSVVLGRSTEHPTSGIVLSGGGSIGNVLVESGSLIVNGGTAVQGDVTLDVLSTTPYSPGALGPYYAGVYNNTNNPNHGFKVGGDWYDPNPLGNYHQGNYEGDFSPLRLQFNGGGNVQTFYTAKSDVESRLQVDEDSHLELNSDFISTYANPGGIIESSLSVRSAVDLGSYDLSITTMTMHAGSAVDAPIIMYEAGSDSGTFAVDELISANYMEFVIEDGGGWAGGDFILLSYNSWTGIKDITGGGRVAVTVPAGWTYGSFVVTNADGGAGMWKLTNLVGLPAAGPACWDYLTQCHGDVDGDGDVDTVDWPIFRDSFGSSYPEVNYHPCGDMDHDGDVDTVDWPSFRDNFGAGVGEVPEDCPTGGTWPPTP